MSEVGEGEVIFDPKNYIADFFGFKTVYFGRKFWKKCPKGGGGGGSSPIQKNPFTQVNVYLQKKRNEIFQKGIGGGGGQGHLDFFQKKHPYLGIRLPLMDAKPY